MPCKKKGWGRMKLRPVIYIFFLAAVIMLFPLLSVGEEKVQPIEPQADKILKQMSEYLSSLEQFSFHSDSTIDKVFTNGQKLQFGNSGDIFVKRPDRLRVNKKGDFHNREFYYDGSTITLFGKDVNFYATKKAPETIGTTLDYITESLQIDIPLADIIDKNAYKILTEGVTKGTYEGLHFVHGVECHHLAFVRDDIDWQIWIENSKTPLPKKIIITEKWVTGSPQFTALTSNWNLSPQLQNSLFTFKAPKGATKIEFLPADKTDLQRK
jgi:hypothetical protein